MLKMVIFGMQRSRISRVRKLITPQVYKELPEKDQRSMESAM